MSAEEKVQDIMASLERAVALNKANRTIGSEAWLRERFPEKDWHRHPRTDGRFDLCDGTPSDCPRHVDNGGREAGQ